MNSGFVWKTGLKWLCFKFEKGIIKNEQTKIGLSHIMSISLKKIQTNPSSGETLWTDLASELSPKSFLNLMQTMGFPIGSEKTKLGLKSPLEVFIEKQIPNTAKILNQEFDLSHSPKTEEQIVLSFFELGEPKFPKSNPTLYFKAAVLLGWNHVLKAFLEEKDWPIKELETIKISYYEPQNYFAKKNTYLTHYLAEFAPSILLEQCLSHGLNIEKMTKDGKTPLFFVKNIGNLKVLLNHRVNLEKRDVFGNKATVFWSSQKIPENDLSKMSQMVLKNTELSEDDLIEGKIVKQIESITDEFKNYDLKKVIHFSQEDQLKLQFPWSELLGKRFNKVREEGEYSLHPLDFIAIELMKKLQLVNSSCFYEKISEIFIKDLIEGQTQFDLYKNEHRPLDGYAYFVLLKNFFYADMPLKETQPYGVHLRRRHSYCVDLDFKHWIERWNEPNFGRMMLLHTRCIEHFQPFFENNNNMNLLSNLNVILTNIWENEPEKWKLLWENDPSMNLTSEEHEEFWITTLRSPFLSDVWMNRVVNKRHVLFEPSSNERINAAQYSALASMLFQIQKNPEGREKEKVIQSMISFWLSKNIEWKTEPEDKKWFSKVNKLKESELGAQLSIRAEQGWLKQKLKDASLDKVLNEASSKTESSLDRKRKQRL